jgi:hypothetical protein
LKGSVFENMMAVEEAGFEGAEIRNFLEFLLAIIGSWRMTFITGSLTKA